MLAPPGLPAEEASPDDTGSGDLGACGETLEREVLSRPEGAIPSRIPRPPAGSPEPDDYSNLTATGVPGRGGRAHLASRDLWRQFCELGRADRYADLILNSADARHVDEICVRRGQHIAGHPQVAKLQSGGLPRTTPPPSTRRPVPRLRDLTERLATDVTYTDARGQVELPRDIYYWYIVHRRYRRDAALHQPGNRRSRGAADGQVLARLLFTTTTPGIPCLRDALSGVPTVWNGTKNSCHR